MGYLLCSEMSRYAVVCLVTASVVYSEEVVLVAEGLIFSEIVGGTCTVSLFPITLVVWTDHLRASAAERYVSIPE